MNPQLWSWVLTAVGVCSLYLAGRRSIWGWVVGMGAQTLWLVYAVTTRQWGFLVSCFAYGGMYVLNFRRWRAVPPPAPGPVAVPEPVVSDDGQVLTSSVGCHGDTRHCGGPGRK